MANAEFWQRLLRWKEALLTDLRKRWWWLPLCLIAGPIGGLVADRVYGGLNRYIDAHLAASLRPFASFVLVGGLWKSFLVGTALAFAVFVGLVIHAYVVTVSNGLRAISGAADLLAIRMDMGDAIHLDADWKHYWVDLGVFCRMSVTANGNPRTVKKFIMEVREAKDGIQQEPPLHSANSEHAIGDFFYRYRKQQTNSLGFAVVKDIFEEMPDLAVKLRTPLAPETHAEGWVRFELKKVKERLEQYHITVYAVDANDRKHEIDIASMRFAEPLEEYVVAKPL